jgi:hypothetical protein
VANHNNLANSFDDLGTDELAHIFGFLPPEDIMLARLNNKMREAAKKAIVPPTDFEVRNVVTYNAMAAMTTALPNLQQITLVDDDDEHQKYNDGEDPDERMAVQTANWTTREIDIISRFGKLRILRIFDAPLNGRYPFLFNFPLLRSLNMSYCDYLNWDLEMLTGLPLLTEVCCDSNPGLTGNINSLRVLKDILTKVVISDCDCVEGQFMDLADFPRLKTLNLIDTAVTGDIRDIGDNDFSAVIELTLPYGVYGGTGYEFQRISDVSDFMNTIHSVSKQRPTLLENWHGELSGDSPDWYEGEGYDYGYEGFDTPPFHVVFVQAGSRVGYQWKTSSGVPCEVNWLDPEPAKESSDYEKYIVELYQIERRLDIYRGFHQPPTEEEYYHLWEERDEI